MIDNHVRALLPQWTPPLIRLYQRFGITPNHLTTAGLVLAIVAAACVALGWNWLALVVWWVGRLLDGTDGILARETNQTTAFGAYLDIVYDMAAYGVMILGFAYQHSDLMAVWLLILFFYVLCITSALALGAGERDLELSARDDRGLRLGAGLAEAGETGIAYSLFLVFPGAIAWLSMTWAIILLVTVVARTLLARLVLNGRS